LQQFLGRKVDYQKGSQHITTPWNATKRGISSNCSLIVLFTSNYQLEKPCTDANVSQLAAHGHDGGWWKGSTRLCLFIYVTMHPGPFLSRCKSRPGARHSIRRRWYPTTS
jgi:hypothetical protein